MLVFDLDTHHIEEHLDPNHDSSLIIPGNRPTQIRSGDTGFGFVLDGRLIIERDGDTQEVKQGMFYASPGPAILSQFRGILSIRHQYSGIPLVGGPLEKLGRLKYIDGCSDTLLLAPIVQGDACLNFLYVPPGIDQTAHTHPSVRLGVTISGSGKCKTKAGIYPLEPGMAFVLEPEEIHSFHTQEDHLRIVVYHPDSDFGPTHEAHPMVNRTYVDGVSLQGENEFRTRSIAEFVS